MEEFLEEASFQSNSLAGSVTTLTPGRNHSVRVWLWPASPQGMLWCQRAWWNVQENTVLCKVNFDVTWGIRERSTLGRTCCPSPSFTFLVSRIACGRGPELGALHYSPQSKYGRCMLKYLYFTEKTGLRKSLVCSKTQLVRGRADIKTQFCLCSKTLHLIITPHGLSMSGNLEGE